MNEQDSPTWAGIRQKGFQTETVLKLAPATESEGMRIGLSAYYNNDYHYEIYLTKECGTWKICLAKHVHDIFAVTAQVEVDLPESKEVEFKIISDREGYTFLFSTDSTQYQKLGTGSAAGLSTEGTWTMTFTGTYLAMFAERADAEISGFTCKVLD